MNPFFKILICTLLGCHLYITQSFAQEVKAKTTRILFLVDGSSSMLDTWYEGGSRFNTASRLINDIMDSVMAVNQNVEFGLRIFGHQHIVTQKNCYDSRMEVRFRRASKQQILLKLNSTSPKGVSPIAWSLQEAALNDLTDNHQYAYSLILITDGGESCGGSICEVMEKVVNYKINFQPYIVSLLDYAPLQQEYACMGKYMLVTKKDDFTPVIKTIMTDNNYFKASTQTKYVPPVVNIKPPVKIDTPKVVTKDPVPVNTKNTKTFAKLPIGLPKPFLKPGATTYQYPVVKIAKLPKFNFPADPVQPAKVEISEKKTSPLTKIYSKEIPKARLRYTPPLNTALPAIAVKKLPAFNFVLEPEAPQIKNMAKIPQGTINTKWRMPSLYTIPISKKIVVKKLPKFNFPAEPAANTVGQNNNQKPNVPPVKPAITKTETNISATDKPDTEAPGTFQIFFTNGKGKYYNSMPQIVIKNVKDNKEVYTGVRKVSKGQPEEMSLPDGEYEITSVLSGRTAKFNVVKGKNQKVEIVVGSGSLSFTYPDTKEFAKGYIAMVSKRFEGQIPAVEHATELVLTYEPANYHIEINTLPPLLYNIDLEFDYSYQVAIPKTGEVQVMNENDLGKILFYHQSAENFLLFYEMNVYGDVEYQKVDFLPGVFQVRYFIIENGKEKLKVKEFKVESKKQVKLTLD